MRVRTALVLTIDCVSSVCVACNGSCTYLAAAAMHLLAMHCLWRKTFDDSSVHTLAYYIRRGYVDTSPLLFSITVYHAECGRMDIRAPRARLSVLSRGQRAWECVDARGARWVRKCA